VGCCVFANPSFHKYPGAAFVNFYRPFLDKSEKRIKIRTLGTIHQFECLVRKSNGINTENNAIGISAP
jgi:hypothetical protein